LSIIKADQNQFSGTTSDELPVLEKAYLFYTQVVYLRIETRQKLKYWDVRQNSMPDKFYHYLDEVKRVDIHCSYSTQ